MASRLVAFLSLLIFLTALVPAAQGAVYSASGGNEAILRFQSRVYFDAAQPTPEVVGGKIESQLSHMFGPMEAAKFQAAPKGDHRVTRIGLVTANKDHIPQYYVDYKYEGTIVVKHGAGDHYPLALPREPDAIYDRSIVTVEGKKTFPCVATKEYTDLPYFWYFWNPDLPGCPLKEGKDYERVNGELELLPSVAVSYPEYSRLVDDKGVLHISFLMGMEKEEHDHDPWHSRDITAAEYRAVHQSLVTAGYQLKVWTKVDIEAITGHQSEPLPYVEDLSKHTSGAQIVVRLFFGPSGLTQQSRAFHYFFKDALENSSVMLYSGHSGLGGHMSLAAIEQKRGFHITPNLERYQIYFFNSCSSYSYYNNEYFNRKRSAADPNGTKNLDILSNGLMTYFSSMGKADITFLAAFDTWASGRGSYSYQDLSKMIDTGNLFGVTGDEDNPTTP